MIPTAWDPAHGMGVVILLRIYPRRPSQRLVLLGLKKRGFGQGKLNGFGGKLEAGESLEASAIRELQEECGLMADQSSLHWRGCLTYIYDTKPKAMEVNVFDVDLWKGEPEETEEMKPAWYAHQEIPLDNMWADDAYWLLQYLDGQMATPFLGRFRFKGHEGPDSWNVLEHFVAPLAPASVPRFGQGEAGAALLVSTVSFIDAPSARPLESFIRYHLRKGFARVMIFVDSPADTAVLDVIRRFPASRVLHHVRGEELLQAQRENCASFNKLASFVDKEVSARQLLDFEFASTLAPSLGCRWILCLDSDELFYTDEDSIVPHFEALELNGIHQMSYLNHEAVPEKPETPDYFATVSLFKQHQFSVPLTAKARSGLRFWMERSRHGQYFLFYDNGKSACRTGLGVTIPKNQHLWQLPIGSKSCTALADPRRMDLEGFRECKYPCILHFPVCGIEWLKAKYRTLGNFPDKWLGNMPLNESFHKDAREEHKSGGDALQTLFAEQVMLDSSQADVQVACGTCARLTDHLTVLDSFLTGKALPKAGEQKSSATYAVAEGETMKGVERGWILSKAMGYLSPEL